MTEIYSIYLKKIKIILRDITVENFSEMKVIEANNKINQIISRLDVDTYKWVKLNVRSEFMGSVNKFEKKIKGKIKYIPKTETVDLEKRIRDQVDKTMKTILNANHSIKVNAKKYIDIVREAKNRIMTLPVQEFDDEIVDEVIGMTIENKKNTAYAYQMIRDYFTKKFDGDEFITINGRNYDVLKYSELVARTELADARIEGTKAECERWDIDLVEFKSTGGCCDICQELDGEIFSLSGDDPEYPMLTEAESVPVHPNCVCNLNPVSRIVLEARK